MHAEGEIGEGQENLRRNTGRGRRGEGGNQREGDAFICKKCGYRWDVAHEQANAAFLASQGRQPAEPTIVAEPVQFEGQDDRPDVLESLNAMTKTELEAFAAERGIALPDYQRKADMIDTIAAALKRDEA